MKTKVPDDLTTIKSGKLVDLLWTLAQERKLIEAQAAVVKKEEDRIEEFLMQTLKKSDLNGLRGTLAQVSVTHSVFPQFVDWDLFYKFVVKHDAFGLLQKRASVGAFKERWDAGEKIPGVEQFTKVGLSVKKA